MEVYPRSNDALNVNPPVGNNHLTKHGSDWLWAVTAVYLFSLLGFVGFSFIARTYYLKLHLSYSYPTSRPIPLTLALSSPYNPARQFPSTLPYLRTCAYTLPR